MKEYAVYTLKYSAAIFNIQLISTDKPEKSHFKTREEAEKWISEQTVPQDNYFYTILEVYKRPVK